MNDIIPTEGTRDVLSSIGAFAPGILDGLRRAAALFESIKSFEDIELRLLRGAGLSPNTYRSYLVAVKQLYQHTEGLNPLQVTAAHVERFYDSLADKVDLNTRALRMRGLKRFYKHLEALVPGYAGPFSAMEPKLSKKLNRTKKGGRTRGALSKTEAQALLTWLSRREGLKGTADHALVLFLITSGLRAAELCSLRWADLERDPDTGAWTASFIGKGSKEATQELYTPAVEAAEASFRAQFRRRPEKDDRVFYSLAAFNGDTPRPMAPHRLWVRIRNVGEAARAAGVIKREIIFSPHLFRRSYATLLYKSGMGLKAIQAKTRHASLEVLTKHYIHDEEPARSYLDKALGFDTAASVTAMIGGAA